MIGDSETVSHDEFLKSLIEYLHKEGEVRSAQEFVDGKKRLYITIIGIIYIESWGVLGLMVCSVEMCMQYVSNWCYCKNLHGL